MARKTYVKKGQSKKAEQTKRGKSPDKKTADRKAWEIKVRKLIRKYHLGINEVGDLRTFDPVKAQRNYRKDRKKGAQEMSFISQNKKAIKNFIEEQDEKRRRKHLKGSKRKGT